jgi:uncharacterized membrane protein YGL010W
MALTVERHRLILSRWLFGVLAARESCNEPTMNAYFKRQLADYVEYHRNPWNGVMHVFGIVFLFLAAILPLSLWPVDAEALGARATVAPIMVLPVLIYWFLLDAARGTAILGAAVMLLSIAAVIVNYASPVSVWSISITLIVIGIGFQIIGHRFFERRQPALMDNPSHLLLGPMFVMAKLFIALGFRHDLAVIIEPVPQPAPRGSSYAEEHQVEPLPHS